MKEEKNSGSELDNPTVAGIGALGGGLEGIV